VDGWVLPYSTSGKKQVLKIQADGLYGVDNWRVKITRSLQHIGKKAGPKDSGRGLVESIIGV